ncbi:hypothetical protein EV421DRAFT_1741584 [Armillaria borealis]|uniref:Uncharacterized protein n=1 Tax=Armillaria borealis TaxID=47425 RepID=A0AA39MFZ4_9AGAR|nr:hypothetical protein EV421DRAFT_1741584 [Armillaria borealis]
MAVDAGALIARVLMDHGISPFSLPPAFYVFFLTLNRFPSGVHRFHCKGRKDAIRYLLHPSTDYTTNVLEELMQALNTVATSGQVLHLGISDAPASVVVKTNAYTKFHALAPFVFYPMSLAGPPWGSVGQGRFKMKEEGEERKLKNGFIRSYTADSA